MLPKLTLKTNTMFILITIWDLRVHISSKLGGKMAKNRIFSYYSSLNIYRSTCKYEYLTVNGRIKPRLTLIPNKMSILTTIWDLCGPISNKIGKGGK